MNMDIFPTFKYDVHSFLLLLTGLDLSSVEFLPADVKDDLSLTSMCQSTKLVLNCVGPVCLPYILVYS